MTLEMGSDTEKANIVYRTVSQKSIKILFCKNLKLRQDDPLLLVVSDFLKKLLVTLKILYL